MILLPLLLAACSSSHDVMEELPNSSIAGAPREDMPESRIESTLARAVTIGEDGPRLPACGGLGQVQGVGAGQSLDMRAAPFANARRVAGLSNGQRLFICTRSIDQRWMGVVVLPLPEPGVALPPDANAPPAQDCGLSDPVESKRVYDGPCRSGWVSSGFVRSVGT